VLENIELKLMSRQYELAKEAAENAVSLLPNAPWPYFYQGEAYRQMADDPKGAARESAWLYGRKDQDVIASEFESKRDENYTNAEKAYFKALSIDSSFFRSERGLGMVYLRQGNNKEARARLSRYMASNSEVKDRQYISNLIRGIPQ
jgi:tetratricopeptide (TPR) repeat protein